MVDQKTLRILFTGGGSGGHAYPLLAVGEALKKVAGDKTKLELYYMGPLDAYSEIFDAAGFKIKTVVSGKLRRYFSLENLLDIPKFFIGFFEALFKMFFIMPDVIFSKGGTGALPVVAAGWLYRIPIIIHESDAIPGLTNLASAWFAKRIAINFERAKEYFNPKKTALVGTPVRKELLETRPAAGAAKKELGFKENEPLLLVIGGSQGSRRINNFILTNLTALLQEVQILHQTGEANFDETEKLSRAALSDHFAGAGAKYRYRPVPYLDVVAEKNAFAAADVIVTRAGSNTLAEIAAFGKPAILVPLKEAANDHQLINAYEFAGDGATAAIIEEQNMSPGILLDKIKEIVHGPEISERMSRASGKFFKPDAAETIAEEILKLAS